MIPKSKLNKELRKKHKGTFTFQDCPGFWRLRWRLLWGRSDHQQVPLLHYHGHLHIMIMIMIIRRNIIIIIMIITLITNRHVLTAFHCTFNNEVVLKIEIETPTIGNLYKVLKILGFEN